MLRTIQNNPSVYFGLALYTSKVNKWCHYMPIPIANDLSFVICTNNTRPSLQHTLNSLAAQTLLPKVLYLINNGKPLTPSQLKSIPQILHFQEIHTSKNNVGGVRNTAVPYLKTRYTAYVDDDVILSPGWIKTAKASFTILDPKIDLVWGIIRGDGNYWSNCCARDFLWQLTEAQYHYRHLLIPRPYLPTPAFMIKTQLLRLFKKPFVEDLTTTEDIIFTLKLTRLGYKIYLNTALSCIHRFRHHAKSAFSRYYAYGKNTPHIWLCEDVFPQKSTLYLKRFYLLTLTEYFRTLLPKLHQCAPYYWPGISFLWYAHHKGIYDSIKARHPGPAPISY